MWFHYTNFVEGMDTQASNFLLSDNTLTVLDNCVVSYKLGAILKRLGYSKVSSTLQSGKTIGGLHNFRQNSATQKMLVTVDDATSDDTQLFYKTPAGAWTEDTASETAWANIAGAKVEMEDFISYCFIVGYSPVDGFLPPRSFSETTSGTTNISGISGGKYIKRYRDRLYIANAPNQPYRVYFSTVPVAGVISWDTATQFFDVDYSEQITGINENWDRLVVFTEYSAYLYNQDQLLKSFDVGCSNHRTIKNSGAYMIWANRDGVWMSTGGRPENIAGRVVDFIRYADPTTFFAEVIDEEYYLYVGNVTVNGVSYGNACIIYDIATKGWRVEETYDSLSILARYNSGGDDLLYMGATDGDVHVKSKYTDATPIYADDGKPIHSWFQSRGLDLGDPSILKDFLKVMAYAERAGGLVLKARVIDKNTRSITPFKQLGKLERYVNEFSVNPDKGYIIQFEGVETSTLPYWSFLGLSCEIKGDDKVR